MRLHEIIVYVRDMDAQVRFYRDVMGLKTTYPPAKEDYAADHWVTFDTGACTLALHAGGQGRTGTDAPKFVFHVDDIEVERARLSGAGVTMGDVRSPAPGLVVCDGRDPEGNAFSLE